MTANKEIETLKGKISSGDWDVMTAATNRLFEIGGQENINYLIGLLNDSNSKVRNAAALTFRENRYNEALEPLLTSINKKENKGYTGTMVYALESLDCKSKLKELFNILFDKNSYEVQYHILTILDEQIFEFTNADLQEIKTKWDELKCDWNRLNNLDKANQKDYDIDDTLIQSYVDGFVSYME